MRDSPAGGRRRWAQSRALAGPGCDRPVYGWHHIGSRLQPAAGSPVIDHGSAIPSAAPCDMDVHRLFDTAADGNQTSAATSISKSHADRTRLVASSDLEQRSGCELRSIGAVMNSANWPTRSQTFSDPESRAAVLSNHSGAGTRRQVTSTTER